MADCPRCGRKLPLLSFRGVCEPCRESMAHFAAQQQMTTAPLAQLRPYETWPPITTALMVLNVVVFIAMFFSGVSPLEPKTQDLLNWGANFGPWSLGNQPWRLLASNYVHIGIIHLALNMWCLWDLGGLAERIFDRWTYLVMYLACGLAGSVASVWRDPLTPNAGASGAIFGIAGALISALYLGKLPVPKRALQATLRSLLIFAGYNLFYGAVVPNISNAAHIGGLITGLLMGAALARSLTAPVGARKVWSLGVIAGAGVLLFGGFTFARHSHAYMVSMQQGIQSFRLGHSDDAIRNFEQAAAHKPDDPKTLVLLGNAYLQKNIYDKAAIACTSALQINPYDQDGQYCLGFSQLKLGRNQQAVDSLEKAVMLDPQDADAENALGQAYQAVGNKSGADVAFRRAEELRKNPSHKI